jgi:hypothetical protein
MVELVTERILLASYAETFRVVEVEGVTILIKEITKKVIIIAKIRRMPWVNTRRIVELRGIC